jgi:hypothetical protein
LPRYRGLALGKRFLVVVPIIDVKAAWLETGQASD